MHATEQECILILDNGPTSREWLAQELSVADYDVVTADTGGRAILIFRNWQYSVGWPGLVICGMRMPVMGDFELLEQAVAAGLLCAKVSFVFLTTRSDQGAERVGRGRSADGTLTKAIDFKMLGIVIESHPVRPLNRSGSQSEIYLTGRQREVLTWIGRGKTSSEIAIILDLSERTVNFHCNQAVKRLDVVNRTQAIAKAVAQGLIPV